MTPICNCTFDKPAVSTTYTCLPIIAPSNKARPIPVIMVTTRSGHAVCGKRTPVRGRRTRKEIIQPTLSPSGILYVPGLENPRSNKMTLDPVSSSDAATPRQDQSVLNAFSTTTTLVESDTVTRSGVSATTWLLRLLYSEAFWTSTAFCLRVLAFITILHFTVLTFPAPGATYYLLGHIVYGVVYLIDWLGSAEEQDVEGTTPSDGALASSVFFVSELLWIIWSQAMYFYVKPSE